MFPGLIDRIRLSLPSIGLFTQGYPAGNPASHVPAWGAVARRRANSDNVWLLTPVFLRHDQQIILVFGETGGKNSKAMKFCADCHGAVAEDQDYLLIVPEEYRRK